MKTKEIVNREVEQLFGSLIERYVLTSLATMVISVCITACLLKHIFIFLPLFFISYLILFGVIIRWLKKNIRTKYKVLFGYFIKGLAKYALLSSLLITTLFYSSVILFAIIFLGIAFSYLLDIKRVNKIIDIIVDFVDKE